MAILEYSRNRWDNPERLYHYDPANKGPKHLPAPWLPNNKACGSILKSAD